MSLPPNYWNEDSKEVRKFLEEQVKFFNFPQKSPHNFRLIPTFQRKSAMN